MKALNDEQLYELVDMIRFGPPPEVCVSKDTYEELENRIESKKALCELAQVDLGDEGRIITIESAYSYNTQRYSVPAGTLLGDTFISYQTATGKVTGKFLKEEYDPDKKTYKIFLKVDE
jgi:hypothetical protein